MPTNHDKTKAAPEEVPPEAAHALAQHLPSVNEPPIAKVPPPVELPPLVLSALDPYNIVISADPEFPLLVTGSGFDATCVVVFDDEELPTTFGDEASLSAYPPMAAAAGVVDVEVHRGEDMSDVLTFEFTAVAGVRSRVTAERKPKKSEPVHKRAKKGKR